MDFGLGLILSFTDNATNGINNAVNGLNRLTETANGAMSSMNQMASLSALSVVSGQLGNAFLNAGTGILGTLTGLLSQVQYTGSEFENFRTTLNALYQDEEMASKQIDKLLDFSVKSPFEVGEVKDMLVVLKSQGIDAFEQMTSAAGDFQQENLAWIADLMAFKPDEATSRWKRALTNFLGSGQDLMLRNILDMGDIGDILGHSVGATVEERMENLREIVEKVNLQGYAEKMSHTMQGVSTNVEDAMTKIYKSIADTGVFENLKGAFMSFKGVLLSLSGEEITAIGTVIGEALNTILKPVTILAEKFNELAHKIVAFAQTHPKVVKMGIVLSSLAGVFLVFIGVVLKVTSALSGLSLMLIASGRQFSSLGSLFRLGALKIIGAIAPLAIAFGMLYVAWKNDLGGIASSLKGFVSNVSKSFTTARSLVNGSVDDMQWALNGLNPNTSFFDGLTIAMMKVLVVGRALVEGWNNFELSEDTFRKVEALGLKPLVGRLFDLLYRFQAFKEGFVNGMRTVLEAVRSFFTELASSVKGTVFEDLFDKITGFFTALTNNDPEQWKRIGKIIGEIATAILLVVGAIKAIGIVIKPFRRLGGIIPFIFGGHGGSGGRGNPLGNPVNLLKALGSVSIIVGGLTLFLTALGSLATNSATNAFLSNGLSVITRLFDNLQPLVGSISVLALLFKGIDLIRLSPSEVLRGLADFALMLGGIELIVAAIGLVSSIPGFGTFISNGATTMNTLVGVLEALFNSKVLTVIGLITAFGLVPISVVLAGLKNLASVLGGLTLLISAFALLSQIPGFNDFISSGGEALSNLFLQIGRIIGAFVGGIAAGATDGLPLIGQNMSDFANNAKPFFDTISSTDTEKVNSFIDALSRFILFAMGEQILSFITGGVDLVGLALQLNAFAQSMGTFFTTVAEFSDAGIEKAPKIFDSITSIGDYAFRADGIAQMFTGKVDIAGVASQLSKATFGLSTFFTAAAKFSDTGIEKTPKAFDAITSVGNYAFRADGIAQMFTGGVDIAGIASQLSKATFGLTTFFTAAGRFSDSGIEKAPKAFDAITSIGNYAFRAGGVAQFFTGEVAIDSIASQLSRASTGLTTFFNSAAKFSDSGIEKAPKAFDAITSVGNYEFRAGGVAQFFTGEVDIAGIALQLSKSAFGLSTFFTAASRFPDDGIAKAPRAFDALTSIGNYEFRAGGVAQFFTGEVALDSIASQLSKAATGLGTFFNTAATYSAVGIARAPLIFDAITSLGDYDLKEGGVFQWFTGSVDLGEIGTDLSDFAENAKGFFDSMGAVSATGMTNGIKALECLTYLESFEEFPDISFIEAVGEHLSTFGEKVAPFYASVGAVTIESITRAGQIFESLDSIGNSISKEGGISQLFTKGTSLTTLGKNLSVFVKNIKPFYDTAKEISANAIRNSREIFKSFESAGSLVSAANSSSGNLGRFGEELVDFAGNFNTFINTLSNTGDTSSISALTEAITTLDTSLTPLSTSLEASVSSITGSFSNLRTSFTETVTTINTQTSDLATTVTTALGDVQTGTSNTITAITTTVSTFVSEMQTKVTDMMGTIKTAVDTGWKDIETRFNTAKSSIQSSVTTIFNGMNSSITSAMATAKSTVSSALLEIQQKFSNTVFKFNRDIDLPHFSMQGEFDAKTGKVPSMKVQWYKTGGVFNEPTLIGVGEAGKEAVMPLENNTAWIKELAYQIGNYLPNEGTVLTPVNTTTNNTGGSSYYGGATSYMTSTNSGNSDSHDVRDSHDVTFEKGSIVVQVMNASEEEAERFANIIMQKVKRKQELEDMLHYRRRV